MQGRRALWRGAFCVLCLSCDSKADSRRKTCFFQNQTGDIRDAKLRGFKRPDFTQDFENGLAVVLRGMGELLGVKVEFGYYDDPIERPNAGADPSIREPLPYRGVSDGRVAIGRNLLTQIRLRSSDYFSSALAAVCAHEHGHILQGKYLLNSSIQRPRIMNLNEWELCMELHADFVCGYYASYRTRSDPNYPAALLAMTQFESGANGLKESSHGTSEQRGALVKAGFLLGSRGMLSAEQVAVAGLDFTIDYLKR